MRVDVGFGDLRLQLDGIEGDIAKLASAAMRETTPIAKQELRAQVTSAGLGTRLANTWRSEVYPRSSVSLNPGGYIWSKAPAPRLLNPRHAQVGEDVVDLGVDASAKLRVVMGDSSANLLQLSNDHDDHASTGGHHVGQRRQFPPALRVIHGLGVGLLLREPGLLLLFVQRAVFVSDFVFANAVGDKCLDVFFSCRARSRQVASLHPIANPAVRHANEPCDVGAGEGDGINRQSAASTITKAAKNGRKLCRGGGTIGGFVPSDLLRLCPPYCSNAPEGPVGPDLLLTRSVRPASARPCNPIRLRG